MTENQYDHTDPNPIRPSQAEGEVDQSAMPSANPAEVPSPEPHGESEYVDPNPLRPSQAEGDTTD